MNFRRFSLSVDPVDLEIDDLMKNLYPPAEEIEKKCHQSLKEDKFGLDQVITKRDQSQILGQVYEKTTEEVVEGLPLQYFTPDYDPLVDRLQEISNWGNYDITKFMMIIEDTDTNKDVIIGHLTTMIDANYDDLMECMQKVQDIHIDLVQTEMQVKYARMKIKTANEILHSGSIKITELGKRRDKHKDILVAVDDLKKLKDLYKSMASKITTGEVGEAAEFAKLILDVLNVKSFTDFKALKSLSESMEKSVRSIRQKSNRALKRLCCRKFANAEYTSIINAYLTLDVIEQLYHIGCNNDDEFDEEEDYFDSYGCMNGLGQRINRFQLEDVDQCLHSAVVEYIYLSQQKKQKAAEEISIAGAYLQMKIDEIVDLTEIPLHLLYKRLTPDLLPPCVVRSCELLADIVHTHYLITQWHHNPFDPLNEDMKYLHKSPIVPLEKHLATQDSDSDSGSNDDDDVPNHEHAQHNDVNASKFKGIRLAVVNQSLAQSRVLLWDELIRGLTNMLQIATFTSSTKLEDFVSMLWALRIMVKLGKEFCGSDSHGLVDCIKEKSDQFFQHFHEESFQVVRMMIEAELWQSIPWGVGGGDDAMNGLIQSSILRESFSINMHSKEVEQSSSPKPFARRASLHRSLQSALSQQNVQVEGGDVDEDAYFNSHPENKYSILVSFVKSGNPFHFINNHNDEENDSQDREGSKSMPKFLVTDTIGASLWDIYVSDSKQKVAKKSKQAVASPVVTQAILNGLLKYSIKYLDMMALIPDSAVKIFGSLCHLYNYYICAVFHGFVPSEDKDKLVGARSKMVSPPPDSQREFEALTAFIQEMYEGNTNEANYVVYKATVSDNVDNDQSLHSMSNSGHGSNEAMENLQYSLRTPSIVAESHISNMFSLNERIIAAESCWWMSQMLLEFKPIFIRLLPADDAPKCLEFLEQFSMVAGQLRAFVYKTVSSSIIQNSIVIQNITDCSWDSKKLRDQPHEWVDKLVNGCMQVWEFMMQTDQFAESSSMVREQLWLEVCQSCFDIVVEGYSKVRKCTAEGRASMTLDVFALHEGLNEIHLCRPPRGKHYVDNYLRAYYLNEDDMMNWIQENWQSYAYRHIHALLSLTLASMLNNKKLRDAIAVIDGLYEVETMPSPTKLGGGYFRQKLMEESRIGNMLSSKFRR